MRLCYFRSPCDIGVSGGEEDAPEFFILNLAFALLYQSAEVKLVCFRRVLGAPRFDRIFEATDDLASLTTASPGFLIVKIEAIWIVTVKLRIKANIA